jgi:predicted extracellular nuclease
MMRCLGLTAKTPLIAAFFALAAGLAGCRSAGTFAELPPQVCNDDTTPIAGVQGDDWYSPMQGRQVVVTGVVTHTEAERGVYVQEPASDLSQQTSDALYLSSGQLAAIAVAGNRLVVAGTVAELGSNRDTLTALDAVSGYRVCEAQFPLPVSDVRLPLSSRDREALEGMNIVIQQPLVVTDAYGYRYGRLKLSADGILPAPTEVARPGQEALDQALSNARNAIEVRLHPDDRQAYAAGTGVMSATGVLGQDDRAARWFLREPMATMPAPTHRIEPIGAAETRIAVLNLHNYFNGDGEGGGFSAPRGPQSAAEFAAKRARLAALIGHVDPHLVAVTELENDGFGARSAARDFIRDLEQGSGRTWSVVSPGGQPVGSDRITVGIFYSSDSLRPSGAPELLMDPPFNETSRVPMAQWFEHTPTGAAFLVVVNHFKSKGSCPDGGGPDADRGDGQGCWNRARVEAAQRLTAWVDRLLEESANPRALILGDLNAYRMEDPIRAIVDAGYQDLTTPSSGEFNYSFMFHGAAGTLDYAFASPELAPHVHRARLLNVNAAYPPGVPTAFPWQGSSDHDPVIVDLRLRHSATSD